MADREIISEWLQKAEDDFQFARISLDEKKPFVAQICFLFQQSAEKYLKAFMLSQGLKLQKIHDLTILLKRCLEKAPRMAELSEDCNILSTFYVETRYPVHWPATFAHEDAEQAFRAAHRIRSFIRSELDLTG
jgi:HEPN domain-containing protein